MRSALLSVSLLPVFVWTSCAATYGMGGLDILREFDELVQLEGAGQDLRLVYDTEAIEARGWNEGNYVRELVDGLAYELEGGWLSAPELTTCSRACSRLLWIAELDENAMTRIRALDALAAITGILALQPFAGDLAASTAPLAPAEAAKAREVLRAAADAERGADGALPAPQAFKAALETLTSQPLPAHAQRVALIGDLTLVADTEPDPLGRAWAEQALREAISHGVRGSLLNAVEGRSRRLAVVRLASMEQIRRLGGPRTVPLLLAAMAASPAEQQAGAPAFDPDTLVMLRLIHYCGQLGPELRGSVVRLPGRQDWEATSPVEFLARTILSQKDYYSQLRTPAIVALTWCLGRDELDPDPAWVRAWLDGRDV